MKIVFLTSTHLALDDRIFYHQAKSLIRFGHQTWIINSIEDLIKNVDGISLNCFAGEKMSKRDKVCVFIEKLKESEPDLIICSEPITILAAKTFRNKYSRNLKIVYDITEWYPSKKNLVNYRNIIRWAHFFKFAFFNLYTCFFADAFIFGEYYKSKPYRILFPFKAFSFIGYYPDLDYLAQSPQNLKKDLIRLSYSGKISIEKGFKNFLLVVKELSERQKDLQIQIKIIGWFDPLDEKLCHDMLNSLPENISLNFYDRQDFIDFLSIINQTDIFLDLRSADLENQYCLPIKLFYYAALGRPVIFTSLKAIRKEVDIDKFGYLVNPEKTEQIVDLIIKYIDNPAFFTKHCRNARAIAEKEYNWKTIEPDFIRFMHNL